MKPKQSQKALTKRIESAGKALKSLTAAEGVGAMLVFYAEERAEGCRLDEDGDMLLFQWGTYDFGRSGETFQLDITRQFILPRRDEPYQLSLTFHFPATPKLARLKSGSRWCESPDELEGFRKWVLASPAYRAVAEEAAKKVELDFEQC
jgi:hypothetical protein